MRVEGGKLPYQGSGLNRGNDFSNANTHVNTKHIPKAAVFKRGMFN